MSWIEIILVGGIFAYAIWAVVRQVRKSKQGACASCALNKSCSSGCGTTDYTHMKSALANKQPDIK
ncbi:FeoB-associated Cys-rich membrane protein [Paenibacillus marinisediminis]